jgi:hypothetical protein
MRVLSPTPDIGAFGDSIKVISSQSRSLFRVVAVIQPEEPPPTMQIFI